MWAVMTKEPEQFLTQSYPYILGGPKYSIIEKVAAEFAAVIYETGRAQGMKSKYKTPRLYAKKNFEKFIPKAIEYLTEMLGRQDLPDLMKAEIYDCLLERANDPTMQNLKEQTLNPMAPPPYKGSFDWDKDKNPFLKSN